MVGRSRKHISTFSICGKGSCSFIFRRMMPEKAMSSTMTSRPLLIIALPTLISRTTLGLILFLTWRAVISAVSFGVKLNFQSTVRGHSISHPSHSPDYRQLASKKKRREKKMKDRPKKMHCGPESAACVDTGVRIMLRSCKAVMFRVR